MTKTQTAELMLRIITRIRELQGYTSTSYTELKDGRRTERITQMRALTIYHLQRNFPQVEMAVWARVFKASEVVLQKRIDRHDYYLAWDLEYRQMHARIREKAPMTTVSPAAPHVTKAKTIESLKARVAYLEDEIHKTIMENLHLADGDACTLKRLVDAVHFKLPAEDVGEVTPKKRRVRPESGEQYADRVMREIDMRAAIASQL